MSLFITALLRVCEELVTKDPRTLEQENMYGDTPLHEACRAHRAEVTERLIQLGAQLDARNMELKTPLHVASLHGNPEVVQHLIDGHAAISPTDLEGHVRILHRMFNFT